MTLKISSAEKKPLGIIEISSTNEVSFLPGMDSSLTSLVTSSLGKGLTRFVDIDLAEEKRRVIVEQAVKKTDPNFPIALKEYLARAGYEVQEIYPEIEGEIKSLLANFPEDEDIQKILQRLPDMSHLEQTFLLEELRAFEEQEKGNA